MSIRKLIIGRNNDETNIVFNKQINIVEDINLSKELGTENIKNEDSSLIIKSMNNIQISDVIQIKINLTSVGTFLANFDKETLQEEDRKEMFESLKALKNKEVPTVKTQTEKTLKILSILDKYKPIYVTFLNKDEVKIDIEKISTKLSWNYPLLILALPPKKQSIFDKLFKHKDSKRKYITGDNFFVSIFSILLSFATVAATNEFLIKENVAIFLTILAIIFSAILCFIVFKIISQNKNKNLPHTLIIFEIIGWVIGTTIAIIISKFLLTTGDNIFEFKKVLLLGGGISLVANILIILITNLINRIKNKNKN